MTFTWEKLMQLRSIARICITLSLLAGTALGQPTRPTDDALVLLIRDQTQEQRTLIETLSADPKNSQLAIAVARDAIAIGRNQGDPRFYGQAQAALAPWWTDKDAPLEIIILRATISQSLHDFTSALSDFDRVITIAPDNLQAHLSRAFIHMVTGNYKTAAQDCTAIKHPRARLVQEICQARVDALTDKGRYAFQRLQKSIEKFGNSDRTTLNFARTVLAEIAISLGDIKSAETLFVNLTSSDRPDVALLAAHADLLLAENRAAEALVLLENRGESDALLLRRAIAAKKTSHPQSLEWAVILKDRFTAAATSNNRAHLREEARFTLDVLDNPELALTLAIENWSTQKEPADMQLVLAAAHASGNHQAAKPVIDFIARTNLDDARLNPLLKKLAAQ
jgi:tetratricopeptide (TPR) repeat protein